MPQMAKKPGENGSVITQSALSSQAEKLLEFTRIQEWPILFQDDPLIFTKKKLIRGKRKPDEEEPPPTNALFITVEVRDLRRNRDGKYLYDKVLHISPENLFPDPNYYILRYRLPQAPFVVEVSLGDNEQLERAFNQFKQLQSRNLHEREFFLLRVQTRVPGVPFYNPIPIKKYKDISFRNRANLIRILNERYMGGSLTLGEMSTLLALETPALQREVFLMLPLQDREDHMYLVEVKPKPPPTPKELYMGGHISIQEYEDLINPEKKRHREEVERGYPVHEDPQVCVVCRHPRALIPCLQCANRICAACMQSQFLGSSDRSSFLLLHHAFCRKHGKPHVPHLPPLPSLGGELSLPYLDFKT